MSAKLLQNHPLHNNSMAARQCDQMLVYKLPNFSKFHKKVAKAVFTYKVRSTKSPNIWTIVARQFLAKNFPKSGHTAARFKENFPKQVRRRRYGGGRVQRSQRRSGSTWEGLRRGWNGHRWPGWGGRTRRILNDWTGSRAGYGYVWDSLWWQRLQLKLGQRENQNLCFSNFLICIFFWAK